MQNVGRFSLSAYSQAASQRKMDEIINAVNPKTPPRKLKRNDWDPDQNAQFHDAEDYDTSSQESVRRTKLRCHEVMEQAAPKLGSPCSHVSCTPGMEGESPTIDPKKALFKEGSLLLSARAGASFREGSLLLSSSSMREGSALPVGAGTGGSFRQYDKYCELFKEASLLTEEAKTRLAPRAARCMLDVNAAEQLYEAEERGLRTSTSLEIAEQEQQFRAWARLCQTKADEMRSKFKALLEETRGQCNSRLEMTRGAFESSLDAMQAAFNAVIEEQSVKFRKLRAEIEEYERRWRLKQEGMEALYKDVASKEALEAQLMTKHRSLRLHQVSVFPHSV